MQRPVWRPASCFASCHGGLPARLDALGLGVHQRPAAATITNPRATPILAAAVCHGHSRSCSWEGSSCQPGAALFLHRRTTVHKHWATPAGPLSPANARHTCCASWCTSGTPPGAPGPPCGLAPGLRPPPAARTPLAWPAGPLVSGRLPSAVYLCVNASVYVYLCIFVCGLLCQWEGS